MKLVIRVAGGALVVTMVALIALPAMLAGMVAARLHQASAAAAQWDIPAQLVPVFEESARAAGVPWVLLAGVASVATDFGRHGPDGVARGDAAGTSIFPVLEPPLAGGMFLADPPPAAGDLQDVRASADWLANTLVAAAAAAAAGSAPAPADAGRFWTQVVASLPLRITAIASQGAGPGAPLPLFASLLLSRLGAPVTTVNLDAVAAWAAGEGSCAAFNPLDTTQPEPGATPFNTLPGGGHVWNYPSLDTGVQATADTLLNGLYQPVVAALQAGAGVAAVAAAVQGSPWGTGAFGSPWYAGRRCAPPPGPPPPVTLPALSGPDAIPATIVARAAWYQAIWKQQGSSST